jgi:CheY-like chemotaxis protein
LNVQPDLPAVQGVVGELNQVWLNLIANAIDAAPERGHVSVTAARERDSVVVKVIDDGVGIPEEHHDRIFEPFFTTKPVGEGTGLGLSLCRNIIEEHGGTIAVESAPGAGATFRIELPAVPIPASAVAAAREEAPPPITPKRILVVDDERDLALTLAEVFTADGHTVDIANNGAEALERVAQRAYDLIFTDTKMPVLDGESFYRELRRRGPGAAAPHVVFLTGDVLSREKQAFLLATGAPFVAKPFDLAHLRRLVHRLFAGS